MTDTFLEAEKRATAVAEKRKGEVFKIFPFVIWGFFAWLIFSGARKVRAEEITPEEELKKYTVSGAVVPICLDEITEFKKDPEIRSIINIQPPMVVGTFKYSFESIYTLGELKAKYSNLTFETPPELLPVTPPLYPIPQIVVPPPVEPPVTPPSLIRETIRNIHHTRVDEFIKRCKELVITVIDCHPIYRYIGSPTECIIEGTAKQINQLKAIDWTREIIPIPRVKCPFCGATMIYKGRNGYYICPVCGARQQILPIL